jgi:hypothetical protein
MKRSATWRACCVGVVAGSLALPAVADQLGPTVTPSIIHVEHIRIDSARSYAEVRAALELKYSKFDDRIRGLLQYGEITRVKTELERIRGDACISFPDRRSELG